MVEAAVGAARASFAGFEEKPDSYYHQAPGLTAEETWTRIAEELGRVSALTTLEGNRDEPLEVADIELIHKGIFEPVFGDKTLGLRSKRDEEVTFPIVMGAQDAPHPGSRRGSGGKHSIPSSMGTGGRPGPSSAMPCKDAASSR